MNFKETELTLRLPGESSRGLLLLPEEKNKNKNNSSGKSGVKRGIDLNHPGSSSINSTTSCDGCGDRRKRENVDAPPPSSALKPPASKAQVVGWPPVRASRKQAIKNSKFVKVAVDGTPYLRKVDLETYSSYQHLLSALEDMFSGLAIRNYMNERAILDQAGTPVEYVPTYEDKDGDWMMVGDVPWTMFVESCKRLRLMKSSETEAVGLAPKTHSKFSSSS